MQYRFNRRNFLWYGSVTLASTVLLKACASTPTDTADDAETSAATSTDSEVSGESSGDFKVAIVLPGVITDGGWNQSGYEGVKQAAEALGAEMAYVEQVDQPDQTEALADFARQGYRLVAGHGGQFDAAIQQVAAEFPDTLFLAVNGSVAGDNYAAVQTNYIQLCYLCGAMGAMMTETQKMAYITGLSFKGTQLQAKAFELGAHSVNPDIEVAVSFTGDFNDIAKGKEAASALIASGVDVMLHNLDNSAPAVMEAAKEKGVYMFGNTTDQLDLAPEVVLTSAVQDIGGAIGYVIDAAYAGNFEGKQYILGLETPEIADLGRINEDLVPPDVLEKVTTLKQDMLEGNLAFEACEENGEPAVCPA
ncbi:MAG: BMP family protein [Leptolyngbya sp. SIO1E4]|nr:BMP family protein [Leptolyngbya sp. SIO1E4]